MKDIIDILHEIMDILDEMNDQMNRGATRASIKKTHDKVINLSHRFNTHELPN